VRGDAAPDRSLDIDDGDAAVDDSLIHHGWSDLNGDKFVQPNDVILSNFVGASNVDPNNPAK
jgi:hypothetical protein